MDLFSGLTSKVLQAVPDIQEGIEAVSAALDALSAPASAVADLIGAVMLAEAISPPEHVDGQNPNSEPEFTINATPGLSLVIGPLAEVAFAGVVLAGNILQLGPTAADSLALAA